MLSAMYVMALLSSIKTAEYLKIFFCSWSFNIVQQMLHIILHYSLEILHCIPKMPLICLAITTLCLKKMIPEIFSCNSSKRCLIFVAQY